MSARYSAASAAMAADSRSSTAMKIASWLPNRRYSVARDIPAARAISAAVVLPTPSLR